MPEITFHIWDTPEGEGEPIESVTMEVEVAPRIGEEVALRLDDLIRLGRVRTVSHLLYEDPACDVHVELAGPRVPVDEVEGVEDDE